MVLRPSAIVEETSPVTKQPRVSQQSHDHIVPRAIFPQESPQRLPHHSLIFPSANPAPSQVGLQLLPMMESAIPHPNVWIV